MLVIGGKPGAAGPPSPFEYWYLAIGEPPDKAYAIAAEGLEHYPENGGLHYSLACYAALAGRREDALRHIKIAFEVRAGVPRVGEGRLRPGLNPRRSVGRPSRTSCRR